jgi:hypothetical protein
MREKRQPRLTGGGTHSSLAALAQKQHGVVSIRQLCGPLGYSESAVGRAVAAGRLHRLHRGVYAVGHARLSLYGDCLAAVLARGPDALLSHGSAAWLWGITRYGPKPLVVSAPASRRSRPPIELHRARGLIDEDRALEVGIPVTSVPRTLLDYATTVRFSILQRGIERAEELRLFDLRKVDAMLARTAGHPGQGPLRRALELYREPVFTRSNLERRFLELVEQAGLPRPSTGFNVAGHELDMFWPEERFAVELDTFGTHGDPGSFESDRLRQEDLMLVDVGMTRVTDRRLAREPRQVIARVAGLLEKRRRELRIGESG